MPNDPPLPTLPMVYWSFDDSNVKHSEKQGGAPATAVTDQPTGC